MKKNCTGKIDEKTILKQIHASIALIYAWLEYMHANTIYYFNIVRVHADLHKTPLSLIQGTHTRNFLKAMEHTQYFL